MTAAATALAMWATLTIAVRGRWAMGVFEAGCIVVALWWLARQTRREEGIRFGLPLAVAAFAALWGFLQLAGGLSVYAHATTLATLQWTSLFLIAFVCRQRFEDPRLLDRFLDALAVFAGLLALYVLVQPHLGPHHLGGLLAVPSEQSAGPFQNRNTYASLVELALPVVVWKGLRSARSSWLWWTVAGVMAASAASVASRAGSTLVAAELVWLLVLACRLGVASRRQLARVWLALGLLGTLWVGVAGWEPLWRRLHYSDPGDHRFDMFTSALTMIGARPWTGFGLGTFEASYARFAVFDTGRIVNFAHNDFLQWGAEGGVFLLAAMLLLAGWCARRALRCIWGAGVPFVFLHALVDYPMQRAGLAVWVLLMAAALDAGGARRSTARKPDHPDAELGQAASVEAVAAIQH